VNRTIKQFAIDCQVVPPAALEDPEGHDAYRTYDNLTQFVERTKQYYMNRAARQCLALVEQSENGNDAQELIRQHFGI